MHNINLEEILGNKQVSLYEVLDAKEKRVMIQQRLLSDLKMPLISFTLNIAGNIKNFPLAKKTFLEGKSLIKKHLQRNNIAIVREKDNNSKTGFEAFFVVNSDALLLKKLMVQIENSSLLGRIFDIDILKVSGEKISREDIGVHNRTCLICNDFAHLCSRSKKHSMEEVVRKTVEIMVGYFNNKFANKIASFASRALMYEVLITPKPGLVDRQNNGSHSDMDIFTFIDSTSVLVPRFREFAMVGIGLHKEQPVKVFERIRYLGMLAEDDMFEVTNNVNTHKGIIFSLGIICTALGYLYGNNQLINTEGILKTTQAMTIDLMKDLNHVDIESAMTHGERLYATHGIKGIREEVASGFKSVRDFGLPTLYDLINKGLSINEVGALTLLNLIANVIDTNIITRSDIGTSKKVQSKLKDLIDEKGIENIIMEDISKIDKEFIGLNISPGGCADLLAITYMLYFIENDTFNDN